MFIKTDKTKNLVDIILIGKQKINNIAAVNCTAELGCRDFCGASTSLRKNFDA